jgi:hypothetical protein
VLKFLERHDWGDFPSQQPDQGALTHCYAMPRHVQQA